MQHCAILCNQKNAKRWEPTNTGREPGLKVWDTGGLNHPCPPSTTDPGLMDLAA